MPSDQSEQLATVPAESLAAPSHSPATSATCARCGASLAADQRYCLECGERRVPMSSVLLAGVPGSSEAEPATAVPSAPPPIATPPSSRGAGGRTPNNTLTVIAGVGVLLLAMGVGVLIGRSGASKQTTAPAEVITVGAGAGGTASTASTPASTEASFTSDWPSGTSGYTVELKTLPSAGTAVSAVGAAKSEATAKGAKSVGALKSEEFSSLPAGSYVIYSGVYHKQAEAQKALTGLTRSFPGAKVVHVASSGESSAATSKEEAKEIAKESSKGVGESLSKPAPPSVVEHLHKGKGKGGKGKGYSEESARLPNVVSTG